jgi:Rrf2 family protein
MLCSNLPPRIYESLKTLCCLANADRPLQAQEIASAAKLPPAQTAKILQMMTWAGFVESRRGTKGGFWLTKPANRIRVTDVADFFAHHNEARGSMEQDGMFKALSQATVRCRKEFSRITVADLARASGCEPAARLAAGGRARPVLPKRKVRGVAGKAT